MSSVGMPVRFPHFVLHSALLVANTVTLPIGLFDGITAAASTAAAIGASDGDDAR